jgi:hypothetical protein
MNSLPLPRVINCVFALAAIAALVLTFALPAVGQGLVEYDMELLPLSAGYHSSEATGMSDGDWDPPIVVGRAVNTSSAASCWIRVLQQWTIRVLPELDPNRDSWANGVVHVPAGLGLWTLVVGASVDGNGAQQPMMWDSEDHTSWQGTPLPILNGGEGEAMAAFKPDGVPLRAILCGWADELPPMAAEDVTRSPQMKLRVPVMWETTTTGERLLRPEFGAGLEGHVNDIGAAGVDGFVAFGGGQSAGGGWMPQMWTSTDGGETWTNDMLPLPVSATSAEAVAFSYDASGNLVVVAGWGQSAAGTTLPLVWERGVGDPGAVWVIHELPVPTGVTQGGRNVSIHKRPGRTTYCSNVEKSGGSTEMMLWFDDGTGTWTALSAADYMAAPEIGMPMTPGGANGKFDAIAATVESTSGLGSSSAALDTLAAILVTTSPTSINAKTPPFVKLAALPNPFSSGLHIEYTLPRDARVSVTIHDVRGAVVTRFSEGTVPAGVARTIHWDGVLQSGRRAASGVYFVRMETPYDIATIKLVKIE